MVCQRATAGDPHQGKLDRKQILPTTSWCFGWLGSVDNPLCSPEKWNTEVEVKYAFYTYIIYIMHFSVTDTHTFCLQLNISERRKWCSGYGHACFFWGEELDCNNGHFVFMFLVGMVGPAETHKDRLCGKFSCQDHLSHMTNRGKFWPVLSTECVNTTFYWLVVVDVS